MVPPVTYIVATELSSPKFGRAFAQGCHGPVTTSTDLLPGDVAVFGSPHRWPLIQAALHDPARTIWYGDHGYLGRHQYYRITRNAYQADGRQPAHGFRFRQLGLSIAPWQTTGRHVLVCPQSPTYGRLFGFDMDDWLQQVLTTLRHHTDRALRVRTKRESTDRPIAVDLHEAHALVTYSSSAALDGLLAGVPVFVLAPFAAAYRMGTPDLTRIEAPVYPDDRAPFFASLAAQQWTLAEIASGAAWRDLQEFARA